MKKTLFALLLLTTPCIAYMITGDPYIDQMNRQIEEDQREKQRQMQMEEMEERLRKEIRENRYENECSSNRLPELR